MQNSHFQGLAYQKFWSKILYREKISVNFCWPIIENKRFCWDGHGLSFFISTTSKYMPRLFRHVDLYETKCQSRDGPIRYNLLIGLGYLYHQTSFLSTPIKGICTILIPLNYYSSYITTSTDCLSLVLSGWPLSIGQGVIDWP